MKKNKLPLIVTGLLAFAFGFQSCQSENPTEENEGEVITEVTLKFTELSAAGGPTGTPILVTASDPQGLEGGSSPTIGTISLEEGKSYLLEISLFNGIEEEDLTVEIQEEKEEHQFFFLGTTFVGSPIAAYAYGDQDADGNPVGLVGAIQVSATPGFNNANFRLILRHGLDKNFPGADNPHWQNFTQAGGESDLDIIFPLVLN